MKVQDNYRFWHSALVLGSILISCLATLTSEPSEVKQETNSSSSIIALLSGWTDFTLHIALSVHDNSTSNIADSLISSLDNLHSHRHNYTRNYTTVQIIKLGIQDKNSNRRCDIKKTPQRLTSTHPELNIIGIFVKNVTSIVNELVESNHLVVHPKNVILYILIRHIQLIQTRITMKDVRQQLLDSSLFQSVNPNLVFISYDESSASIVTWMPVCYLCDKTNQPLPMFANVSSVPEPNILISKFHILNSNGFGKPAFTPRNPPAELQPYRDAELSMRKTWKGGFTIKALMGLMSRLLNFTFSNHDTGGRPRLYVCSHCTPEFQPPIGTPELSLMHINQMSFFYCRTSALVESSSSLQLILNPFQSQVWICVLLGMILVGLIYKDPWLSLDIIWGIFAMPFVINRWKQSGKTLLAAVITVAVFYGLQFPYMAFFTSAVIIPFPPLRIKSNEELFQTHGFRILTCSPEEAQDITQHAPKHIKSPSEYFTHLSDDRRKSVCETPIEDTLISSFSDWVQFAPNHAVTLVQAKFTTRYRMKVESLFPKLYCNSVKEIWDTTWVTINSNSHLSSVFRWKLLGLRTGGFDVFWESLFIAGVKRQAAFRHMKKSGGSDGDNNGDGSSSSSSDSGDPESSTSDDSLFTSPMFPLFKSCFWLLVLSSGAFICELCYFTCRNNKQKLKYAYLWCRGNLIRLKYYLGEYFVVLYEIVVFRPNSKE